MEDVQADAAVRIDVRVEEAAHKLDDGGLVGVVFSEMHGEFEGATFPGCVIWAVAACRGRRRVGTPARRRRRQAVTNKSESSKTQPESKKKTRMTTQTNGHGHSKGQTGRGGLSAHAPGRRNLSHTTPRWLSPAPSADVTFPLALPAFSPKVSTQHAPQPVTTSPSRPDPVNHGHTPTVRLKSTGSKAAKHYLQTPATTYPNITALHFIMSLSQGAPLIPLGGSCEKRAYKSSTTRAIKHPSLCSPHALATPSTCSFAGAG